MDKDAAVAALVTTPAGGRNAGAASSLLPCFPSQSQVPASCASTGASLRAEWILHEEMSANRTGLIRSNTEVSPFHNAPELLFIFFFALLQPGDAKTSVSFVSPLGLFGV